MKISVGLDIGSTTIKLVALQKLGNRFQLKAATAVATPAKGMQSDSPFDLETMVASLRKIFQDLKLTSHEVSIALAENQVFTKVVEMPVLSDKELSSAIYWEAEQYIPAPLAQMTLDWQVLKRDKVLQVGSKMLVLLVAAPTSLVQKYQRVLELSGLSVVAIETEILSVVRSIVSVPNFPTSLIINIGNHSTSLAIVQSNILVFSYSLPLGGIAMNQAIAQSFGFTLQQAEEYKKVYGITDQSFGGKIGKAIEPILFSMLSEVKKAHAFYGDKYKQELPISQLILTGGTARLPGIDLFFVKNVGIETIIANPWKTYKIENVTKEFLDRGPEFAVAAGLALKGYEQ